MACKTQQVTMMSTPGAAVSPPSIAQIGGGATVQVQYAQAARRHMVDAEALRGSNRLANAGQLYGFVAECGLKALLVACGVQADPSGGIPQGHKLRQHMPNLHGRIAVAGSLIPNGSLASQFITSMSHTSKFSDWSVDHRYWSDSTLPLTSVPNWRLAAQEVLEMMDKAKEAGVLA